MGITVREALQIGGLASCKLVAGNSGIDKEIRYITVMEVPDVIRWLKGNDLLLTSFYPIKDDADAIASLVEQLHEVNSSALAVKTKRYIDNIPQAIIEAGDRLGVPIIEIDNELSYLDIMTPLMEVMLTRRGSETESDDALLQWLTELAMGGKGLPALIDALGQATGNKVTIATDIRLEHVTPELLDAERLSRTERHELKTARRSIRMVRPLEGAPTDCIVTPLMINEELQGYTTCWSTARAFVQRDYAILDRAVPLLAMEFLKAITRADVEQTYKDDFLSDVLAGQLPDVEETVAKAARFGCDLRRSYQVIVVSHSDNDSEAGGAGSVEAYRWQELRRRLVQATEELLSYQEYETIVTVRKQLLVVLVACGGEGATGEGRQASTGGLGVARQLCDALTARFREYTFRAGVGRLYEQVRGIAVGYAEAVKSLELGARLNAGSAVRYEDLTMYRLLDQVADRSELERLHGETVGPLASYDDSHGANLLQTLTAYFAANCGMADTAERLFVHTNTIKYRLQKIEQLTSYSVHDAEQRLLLQVGLKIGELLQAERRM